MEHPDKTNATNDSISGYLLLFPFLLWGILIGFLAGLTTSEITGQLMTAIFSIAGSLGVVYFTKMKPEQIKMLGKTLTGFAVGTLAGLIIGICAKEQEWFIPAYKKSNIVLERSLKKEDSLFKIIKTFKLDTGRAPRYIKGKENADGIIFIQQQIKDLDKKINDRYENPQSVLKRSTLRINVAERIDRLKREQLITPEQAYDSLYKAIQNEKK